MSRRWRTAAGLVAALAAPGAPADLVGRTAAERALLEANPVLERIARERPDALGPILDRLRAPGHERRSRPAGDRAEAEAPDGGQDGLLAENPALADYHRDSPEAALDLLRLIREATKAR